MEDKEEQYERIEQYLAGSLSREKLQAFEAQLVEDPAFREEVNLHRNAQQIIGNKKRMQMKALVESVAEAYQHDNRSSRSWKSAYFLAAGVLLLIAFGSISWWFSTDDRSDSQLFAAYYDAYPAYNIQRNAADTVTNPLTVGLQLYAQKDYETAQLQLEEALRVKEQPMTHFYLGICALELKRSDLAIAHFEAVIDEGNSLYTAQAEWYLALSFLLSEQHDLAVKQLQKVSDTEQHSSREKAINLLKELQ